MQLGDVIGGKYRLLRLIGDGGMGAVYEGFHEVLGARVAIKVIHADLAGRPELVDRFLREARVLAQLSNPHVVRVLDIALAEPGRPAYIVMELLQGEPLSSLLSRTPRVPLPVAVDYTIQVLDALAAAHTLGVVHRDLKPENVFITWEGGRPLLKVIDFGIAKAGTIAGATPNLTISGAMMGTPEYMAPEQAHSAGQVDGRADIYAVGVMLYEMLCGARPVDGDNPAIVAIRVERGEIEPLVRRMPEVPPDLAGLVHRAMAPRPDMRFGSAVEMRAALEAFLAGQRVPAVPSMVMAPTPEPPRGTGTMFGTPAGDISSTARMPPGVNPVDLAYGYPPMPPGPPPGPHAWTPSQVTPGGMAAMPYAAAPPVHARRRGSGAMVWGIALAIVLLCGGVVAALVYSSSSGPEPSPLPLPSATVAAAPTTGGSSAAATATADPGVSPLPTPPLPRGTHAVTSAAAHPSASGAPAQAPSAVASAPTASPPFGVPPFGFPSALPNPFPSPNSSGVGPVITFPTVFPPFGLPPSPAPATSGASRGHAGH